MAAQREGVRLPVERVNLGMDRRVRVTVGAQLPEG